MRNLNVTSHIRDGYRAAMFPERATYERNLKEIEGDVANIKEWLYTNVGRTWAETQTKPFCMTVGDRQSQITPWEKINRAANGTHGHEGVEQFARRHIDNLVTWM